jgi:hypothetical protein
MRRIIYCVAGQGGPHLSVGQYISHPPITFSISDCFPYIQPLDIPKDRGAYSRGGHRHLQIGRMRDIDLISEPPPTPPPPRCMYPKCGNLCGQRGRKRFIASWGLRMSHICPCTPCPSPQRYRSKVESRHFAGHWLTVYT